MVASEPGDRRLYLAELLLISWIADIGHNRQATKTGDNLTQEIEALAGNFGGRLDRQAGNIGAWLGQTSHDTEGNRVAIGRKDDWDDRSRLLGSDGASSRGDDAIDFQ